MLITKEITITLGAKNLARLKKLYDIQQECKPGDNIKIPIQNLTLGSKIEVEVECDYCGKLIKVPYRNYVKYTSICKKYSCSNTSCSNQKIKEVCQIKYGVDNPFQDEIVKDKIKNKLIDKYGVSHPMHLQETKDKVKQTSLSRHGSTNYTQTDEYLEKTKKTNLEKYGVEWSLQSLDIRDKGKKTLLSKWGVEFSSQTQIMREKTIQTCLKKWGFKSNAESEECKQKAKSTSLERYGVDNPMKFDKTREKFKITNDPFYIEYLHSKISLFNCDCEKEHKFEINSDLYFSRKKHSLPLCTLCYPVDQFISIKEEALYDYIKVIYDGNIIKKYRDGLEIDIYLPERKIGFEFNELYWHSEKYKQKDYHLHKTEYFKNKGIRIIHIWEDDWVNKINILKSQIKNWLGICENRIYARNCVVKEIINKKEAIDLLESSHIQGADNSNIKIGLYHNEILVSVMTFDKNEGRKKLGEKNWNLSRFCNKLNYNVIGGASKLLKYFIRQYNPKRIISYADRSWSNGELYFTLNFTDVDYSRPDYKYVVQNKRIHKSNYRKSKLRTQLTESQWTKQNQIYKIWDCGKIKFEIVL